MYEEQGLVICPVVCISPRILSLIILGVLELSCGALWQLTGVNAQTQTAPHVTPEPHYEWWKNS